MYVLHRYIIANGLIFVHVQKYDLVKNMCRYLYLQSTVYTLHSNKVYISPKDSLCL